jgi:hypothetical protein
MNFPIYIFILPLFLIYQQEKPDSRQNHQTAQNLSHGDHAKKIANLGIGLPEEFDRDPENTIKDEEECEEGPRLEFSF